MDGYKGNRTAIGSRQWQAAAVVAAFCSVGQRQGAALLMVAADINIGGECQWQKGCKIEGGGRDLRL